MWIVVWPLKVDSLHSSLTLNWLILFVPRVFNWLNVCMHIRVYVCVFEHQMLLLKSNLTIRTGPAKINHLSTNYTYSYITMNISSSK